MAAVAVAEVDAGTKTTRPTPTSLDGRTSQSTTRDSTVPGSAGGRNRVKATAQSEAGVYSSTTGLFVSRAHLLRIEQAQAEKGTHGMLL